ncbi:uncharacterized protein LOC111337820 [Stylophora pistillata]|uniref:uncharacterized protein LOC111337820 n=1 Tax=Stylophora pistillata TaxID=50429 RepID=UPI000C049110|nr:uncharacterized protein LOC111337820 [Stylophora pistillata]
MSALSDIDEIDDIVEMVAILKALKIPNKELRTLDEMRQRVKETLRLSEKRSSWTAKEAFSVLTEAKKEDEEKRATLLQFYERTSACLDAKYENVLALLEKNIGNLWEKIVSHKQVLQKKEYIVLVSGEIS